MVEELVILSGKGGTGKTSLAASFAVMGEREWILADCDVDAPNLQYLLEPTIEEQHPFSSSAIARIDKDRCDECGLCRTHCRFDSIDSTFEVDDVGCEGCGLCSYVCPRSAIAMQPRLSGYWFRSQTRGGIMLHAQLGFGEGNSGKLVARVKEEARQIAQASPLPRVLVDGPPGVGCPVIAALSGATAALLVAEPSISALGDLERIAEVCAHFQVPAGICINRFDAQPVYSDHIASLAKRLALPILGRIPYDEQFTWALLEGRTIVEGDTNRAGKAVRALWQETVTTLL